MPVRTTVGLLHPGEMGAAIGAQLVLAGHLVLWCPEGRAADTKARAEQAGLEAVASIKSLTTASDVILSVVPPAAAAEVASSIGAFSGLYVDANAISPATTREVAEIAYAAGARYVDAGIIGGPPRREGDVRVYLSGPEAPTVGDLFVRSVVDARVASDRIGDASAIKMAYAGWTKGSAALLLTMREFAARVGVDDALLTEWADSQPDLEAKLRRAERSRREKGWRWVGEMHEIADSLGAVGLPDGFHRAAAETLDGVGRPLGD
jgi:3-hydroxyisobutyrate dehydrogenase-like beta-hydroxyacid dehydrogenase